jgi:serine/threonine protein kinase/Flp pilus assembly protein TadD
MTENAARIESLFAAAAAIPVEDERGAFLDKECAGDLALRGQLDVLLRAHQRSGHLLDRPAVAAGDETEHRPANVELQGLVIAGRYKLLEQIAEGGMGAVWVAEQTEPVKRRVAVKLVKPGMDSNAVVARFEAERQALALMDHQNIAKVLDGGVTEGGRPFFAMELVKGMPLTEYCDARRLNVRERLDLFVQICSAVQHAHQKGIIHRDLKPSNILVTEHDGRPVPKVIDFGLAKALSAATMLTERTLHTAFGTVVGTPLYMAPEQVAVNALDVDTRSDVYSLGVILYELLTGTTPLEKQRFKEAAWEEIRRLIREEDPPKPSARLSGSHDSLPSISAQRHTEPAALTKLVKGELDWIVMKALEKDRNRRYETANGFSMDVQRYLADEPVEACPPSSWYRFKKFVRRNKGSVAAAGVLGLAALIAVGAVAASIGWNARMRTEREAKAASHVASITDEVKRLEEEQKWPEALAAAKRAEAAVASGEVEDSIRRRVADMLKDLTFIDRLDQVRMSAANWLDLSFDYFGADRGYAAAFREYGVDVEVLPVETSIARLQARPSAAIPLAAALDNWANIRWKSKGDVAGRTRLRSVANGIDSDPLRNRIRFITGCPAEEAAEELRRLARSINVRLEHPATLAILSEHLFRENQQESAVRLLLDAQRVHPGDFWLNIYLAYQLHLQKDDEGAVRFYTAAVSLRPRSTAALNNLGLGLARRKKLDEANFYYRKAIELDPNQATAYASLGNLLLHQNSLDEAVMAFRKVIELRPKSASAYHSLGKALWLQKKPDDAFAAYRKSIELDPNNPRVHDSHAGALSSVGKRQEAVEAYRKVIELDPKNAHAHASLAGNLTAFPEEKFHNPVEAVALARKAIELDPGDTRLTRVLGDACYRAKDWNAAIAALERSNETGSGGAREWLFLAMAHWRRGEKAKAREWLDRAIAWMDKQKSNAESLQRLRQEAKDLLEVKEKPE